MPRNQEAVYGGLESRVLLAHGINEMLRGDVTGKRGQNGGYNAAEARYY